MKQSVNVDVIKADLGVTGMPKFKLAQALSVPPWTLWKWLSGRSPMPREKFEEACTVLRAIRSGERG